MKNGDDSLRFALINVLYNLWNYSEKDKDPQAGRLADRMGDEEQRKAEMGDNSQSVPYFFF